MIGPVPVVTSRQAVRAARKVGLMGISRPLFFLAAQSRSSIDVADFAGRVEDHVPGQLGDLAGPQPGLDRQQHDQLVTDGVAGVAGKA